MCWWHLPTPPDSTCSPPLRASGAAASSTSHCHSHVRGLPLHPRILLFPWKKLSSCFCCSLKRSLNFYIYYLNKYNSIVVRDDVKAINYGILKIQKKSMQPPNFNSLFYFSFKPVSDFMVYNIINKLSVTSASVGDLTLWWLKPEIRLDQQ